MVDVAAAALGKAHASAYRRDDIIGCHGYGGKPTPKKTQLPLENARTPPLSQEFFSKHPRWPRTSFQSYLSSVALFFFIRLISVGVWIDSEKVSVLQL